MPLKKGKSDKTISQNIEKGMREYKKTGKFGSSKPKSKDAARKQIAAAAYAAAGRTKKKPTDEDEETSNSKLTEFITSISSKNYAAANKYLKSVIHDKIMSRISIALNKPLF